MNVLFSIGEAVAVRCIMVVHSVVCTWYVAISLENDNYYILLCLLAPLLVESFYTIIKRQGKEFAWFTPCIFFYLVAVLPGIWILELDRTELTIQGKNFTDLKYMDPNDIQIPGSTQRLWLIVIEEMMPYVIFISRWILPKGNVTRKELAELLISFIGIGSDIMEFFSMIGEDNIRLDRTLIYVILSVWTISVLQFAMTITVIHNPKSKNSVKGMVTECKGDKKWQETKQEIYAIFLSIVMQDLPFVVVRLYRIVKYNAFMYSLIFFTCKNLLKIVVLLYKVCVLCIQDYHPHSDEEDDDNMKVTRGSGDGQEKRSGHRRTDSFAGSLHMCDIGRNKSDLCLEKSYSPKTNHVGDLELGFKKRQSKSRKRNHSSNSNETNSAEINETLFYQHEIPLPVPHRQGALFRPDGFGYFSEPDEKSANGFEKSPFRNDSELN